ncbi:MAG: transposase, partial [Pontiellaceae bacterium]|nr:transposase [Pontiellaceae bacterium]
LAWGPACYALRDRDDELASPATLCRMENEVQRDAVEAINALFVEQFISSYSLAPKEIILDFDAMDGRFIGDTVGVLTLADHFRRFFIGSGHVKVGPALNADRC